MWSAGRFQKYHFIDLLFCSPRIINLWYIIGERYLQCFTYIKIVWVLLFVQTGINGQVFVLLYLTFILVG